MVKDEILRYRAQGKTYKEICKLVGCSMGTVSYWVSKSEYRTRTVRKSSNLFDKERLEDAVSKVKCWSDLCKELGKSRTAALHVALRDQVDQYGIDVSHFIHPDPRKSPKAQRGKTPLTLEDMLESKTTKSNTLRLRLISEGIKEHKCENCNLEYWLGNPIPLELDHIDGDHSNNKLENLKILCPNCHSLTPYHRVPYRLRKQK